jgi:hypothetical protein
MSLAFVPSLDPEKNAAPEPYKFLDFFTEKDERKFGGRENDIREVVAGITTERVFVLYGRSGLGKTSLLLAGTFPELVRRGFLPVYCRVLESPLGDVTEALSKALQMSISQMASAAVETLKKKEVRPILVLDQFEEIFTRFSRQPEEKRALVRWLVSILKSPALEFHVLISLREDFLALIDEFGDEFGALIGSNYRLRPLTAFGARQAIIRPLNELGISYEAKMVSRLVDMLASEEFDSLLLQLSCTAIYQNALQRDSKNIVMRESDLSTLGGIEGILTRYLDSATKGQDPVFLLLMRNVLDALITTENTKRAATIETICKSDFNATVSEIESVLTFLKKWRLLRDELRRNQMWYELMHERLVGPILTWFSLDKAFAEFRYARDVVVSGARNAAFRKEGGALLAKQTIEQVVYPYRERLRLEPAQAEYVFRSAVYHKAIDAAFWVPAVGIERARVLLLELMSSSDSTARIGGAAAVERIPPTRERGAAAVERIPPTREMIDKLAEMALKDPEPEVRRAAGRALAMVENVGNVSRYCEAAKDKALRKPLWEALADAYENGKSVKGFGLWTGHRARKIAKRRILDRESALMREKSRTGARTGLVTGLLWMAFMSVIAVALSAWTGGLAIKGTLEEAWGLIYVLILAVPTSLMGARAAVTAATSSAQKRSPSWFRDTLQTWIILLFLTLLTTPLFYVISSVGGPLFIGWCLIIVVPLTADFLVAGMMHLNQRVLNGGRGSSAIFWSTLQSLGLPFLMPMAGVVLAVKLQWITDASLAVFSVIFIGTSLSTISMVLAMTFARVTPASEPPGKFPFFVALRLFVLTLPLLLAGWYLFLFGIHSLPFLPVSQEAATGNDLVIKTHMPAFWPTSRYFVLKTGDAPQWYRYSPSERFGVRLSHANSSTSLDSRETFLLIPAGTTLGVVTTSSRPKPEDINLKFSAVEPLNSSVPLTLDHTWSYRQLSIKTLPASPTPSGAEAGVPKSNARNGEIIFQLKNGSYRPEELVDIRLVGVTAADPETSGTKPNTSSTKGPPASTSNALGKISAIEQKLDREVTGQRFTSKVTGLQVEEPLVSAAARAPVLDLASGGWAPHLNGSWARPTDSGEVHFKFEVEAKQSESQDKNASPQPEEMALLVAMRLAAPFGPGVFGKEGFTTGIEMECNTSSFKLNCSLLKQLNGAILELSYPGTRSFGGMLIEKYSPGDDSIDISGYKTLSVETRSVGAPATLGIVIRNGYAYDQLPSHMVWKRVTPQWETYTFTVSSFQASNLTSLRTLLAFYLKGNTKQTVQIRSIRFSKETLPAKNQAPPVISRRKSRD